MRARRRLFFSLLVPATICLLSLTIAGETDQAAAERVLGPQWKRMSRRAGIIFAGTVLRSSLPESALFVSRRDRLVSAYELSFRVDRAIAGVKAGEVLTIHEWAGAASMQRPMVPGEHVLLFLYRPSRLGLTSPVGGWLGQVRLDVSGGIVLEQRPPALFETRWKALSALGERERTNAIEIITVEQLERAVRAARTGR